MSTNSFPLFDVIFQEANLPKPRRLTPVQIAEDNRDTAINNALKRAGEEWAKEVTAELIKRIAVQVKPFLVEDITQGLPKAHDARAIGGVIRRLAKQGVIRKCGYAPARTSHMSPKVLWSRA